MKVYQACVFSMLLYGSEAWTLYSHQDYRLNAFHLHCLRRILGITWHDCVPNKNILAQVGIPSMFALLTQRYLHWFGHVSHMQDSWIPKDVLYGEYATGSRPAGRPVLWFKDICKQDLQAGNINSVGWEVVAADSISWRLVIKAGIWMSEQWREDQWEVSRDQHPWNQVQTTPVVTATEPVTPGSGCTATAGTATQSQTNP